MILAMHIFSSDMISIEKQQCCCISVILYLSHPLPLTGDSAVIHMYIPE